MNILGPGAWFHDDAEPFWMEENLPSGKAKMLLLDEADIDKSTYDLLKLLGKFNVIEFGCFYESVDMIRIMDARSVE